jgi:hypothetical protein
MHNELTWIQVTWVRDEELLAVALEGLFWFPSLFVPNLMLALSRKYGYDVTQSSKNAMN